MGQGRLEADVRVRAGVIVEVGHAPGRRRADHRRRRCMGDPGVYRRAHPLRRGDVVGPESRSVPTAWRHDRRHWELCDLPRSVSDANRAALVDMFCYIEDLPVAAVADAVPWTWSSWAEFRDAFNAGGASCNIAPLVGHNNLRMSVLGEDSFDREATEQERRTLSELLVDCVEAERSACR